MIHAAMNEGKSTPISLRVTGKDETTAHQVASAIRQRVAAIDGVVDARVIQRLNYPEYRINVDRKKAADLGLTQRRRDAQCRGRDEFQHPVQQEQLLDRPQEQEPVLRRGPVPREGHEVGRDTAECSGDRPQATSPVPLRNLISLEKTNVPTEVTHFNIQPTIELTMGVHGRDLGHVAETCNGRRR